MIDTMRVEEELATYGLSRLAYEYRNCQDREYLHMIVVELEKRQEKINQISQLAKSMVIE